MENRNVMENVCVKVLSKEHGAEVIRTFKELGVDTYGFKGITYSKYYGLFNGRFIYCKTPENSKVITLEELKAMVKPYPKMMKVWDHFEDCAVKREVITEVEHNGVKGYFVLVDNDFCSYRYAKEIEPTITITMKEIAEKFGVDVERIEIEK